MHNDTGHHCRSLTEIRLQIQRWRTKWRPCKGMPVSQAFIFHFKCYSILHSPYASFCAGLSCINLPAGRDRWNLFAQQLRNHQQFAWKIVRAATEIECKATNTHCLKKIKTCTSVNLVVAKHFHLAKRRLYELFRKKRCRCVCSN